MKMIQLYEVTKSFGENKVLDNFSAKFEDGAKYFISGHSGSGKTTLLNIIAGVCRFDSGSISVAEGTRFSYIFQDDRLIPFLSVGDNVRIVDDGISKNSVLRLLSSVGLERDVYDLFPEELSGGMKKRAAIVRAVAFNGDVFLLDEPFGGLDSVSRQSAVNLLKNASSDKTVLLATHNSKEAEELFGENFKTIEI